MIGGGVNDVFISKVMTYIIVGNLEMDIRRVMKIFSSSHSPAWDKGGAFLWRLFGEL